MQRSEQGAAGCSCVLQANQAGGQAGREPHTTWPSSILCGATNQPNRPCGFSRLCHLVQSQLASSSFYGGTSTHRPPQRSGKLTTNQSFSEFAGIRGVPNDLHSVISSEIGFREGCTHSRKRRTPEASKEQRSIPLRGCSVFRNPQP